MRNNDKVIIDWNKFKGHLNREDTKNAYIEFCKILDETDFELVGDYVGSHDNAELRYKLDNNVKLKINPNNFKASTYKRISIFKEQLIINNDEFIKFVGLTNGNSLISQIKTFDSGVADIDIVNYIQWNRGRQDFYNKLKEVGGYTSDFYIDANTKINIYIDDVKLNSMSPNTFRTQTYRAIIRFKNYLRENNDRFIKFIGLSDRNSLIAKIKTFDDGIVDIDISAYSKFTKSRQDFYEKLKEVNGYTKDYYKNNRIKISIYIDDIKLNPMNSDTFKRTTYKAIIDFKNKIKRNNDKFIRFVGLTEGGNLIANIVGYDGGIVNIDLSKYDNWLAGRNLTYSYCKEKGFKMLSSYINATEKILIDFNCGHKPHWTKPPVLKRGKGCPICDESKGEKAIRFYLEKK